MTNFGGFPYSFPIFFGAGGGEVAEVGDMFLSDFEEELLFNLIKENPRSRTRTIRNYYTPQSDYPSTIKEEIGTKELSFSGFFDYSLVESKHIRERKLDYFLGTDNRLLIINIPRDYATYFVLKTVDDVDDASFRDIDTFRMDGSAKGQLLGQMRLAVDDRCTTTGAKKGDSAALQNRAVRLDSPNEYILFNLTQGNLKLPVGNYEFIIRAKAEQADTMKLEVLNLDDTDEWTNVYTPGAVDILCLKVYKDILYAGTSDGKIYESENGTDFSLAFNTGQTEVHCLEEFEDCLYAGTGNNGYIYKYDEAVWSFVYDTGETDVFCLKEFCAGLYAGTGGNGKLFRSKSGLWVEYTDLVETSVFALEIFNNNLYVGTGANGKIIRFLFGIALPVDTYWAVLASPAGLTWDGSNIWSCNHTLNKIYKHNADMSINATYNGLGDDVWGLTYDGTVIWSCGQEGGVGKIWKHNADMTENTEYNYPSNYPGGLTWDGSNIWSADRSIYKIYKHNADMSVNTAYDSPSTQPEGLAWDGERIWSCDLHSKKIYKHNTDMTVDFSYSAPFSGGYSFIRGLTWDGERIWSCDSGSNKIYKHKIIGTVYDSADTDIYALKSFESILYAGGDGGNIYKSSDGDSWNIDYATGEAEVLSLFELASNLYAGTGVNGKLFALNGTWALDKDLEDVGIYAGATCKNRNFIGTGDNGNIYLFRNGILAGEQKTLSTAYKLYKLPFSITSLDSGDTIRFKITKDGSVAAWVNVDFLCFVATR